MSTANTSFETKGQRVLIVGAVLLLLVIAGVAMLVFNIKRSENADKQALQAWFTEHQAHCQKGLLDQAVEAIGPRTREWTQRIIQAALQENEEQVLNRDLFEMGAIMSLRADFSATQLQRLSVNDVLKRRYSDPDDTDSELMELTDIQIDNTGASARISQKDKTSGSLFLGEGRFFTRINGQWRYEPHLLERDILLRIARQVRSKEDRKKLVESSVSTVTGKPFDPALWSGPRAE